TIKLIKRLLIIIRKISKSSIRGLVVRIFIFLSPLLTTAIVVIIHSKIDNSIAIPAFTFFYLLVFAHAGIGGGASGMFASLITAIAGNFLFLTPRYEFKVDSISLFLTMIYFVQAVLIAYVTGKFFNINKFLGRRNKELITNTDRLREVINSVFTIIAIVDREGRIVEANKTFMEITGYSQEILTKKNILNTLPWSSSKGSKYRLKEALKRVEIDYPVKYDDRIEINENEFIDVEINVVGVEEGSNRKPNLIIISTIDISSRKLYEEELIKGREIYTKLISSNIIGMVIGDSDGNITEANKSFLNLIGYEENDFRPGELSISNLVPKQFQDDSLNKSISLSENGFYSPVESELTHKDGRLIPIMMSGVVLNKRRNEYLRLIVDLSSQKELERKKDEFISIASHELKTPLTTLKGYTQVLQQNLTKRYQENMKYTTTIDNQLNKLNSLINELLDITKIQSGKLRINKERVSITDVIRESIEEIIPFIDNHKINFRPAPVEIFLDADKFRIEQVITNFLTNAIKYSQANTDINVFMELLGNKVKVSIEDFGIGISKENLEKIFEKFFQSEVYNPDSIEGLGLGLYISSEIIKNHGGEIGVKSEPGKGSVFFFTLPLN
ncbi:MAG: ATP-binding protein, partial [Candidatus Dojkabacteria bacterium]